MRSPLIVSVRGERLLTTLNGRVGSTGERGASHHIALSFHENRSRYEMVVCAGRALANHGDAHERYHYGRQQDEHPHPPTARSCVCCRLHLLPLFAYPRGYSVKSLGWIGED